MPSSKCHQASGHWEPGQSGNPKATDCFLSAGKPALRLKNRGEPGTASSKEVEGTLVVSKWVAYLWVPETCSEGSTAHSGPGAELKAKGIEPRCGKTWDSSHLHLRGWFPSRKDTPVLRTISPLLWQWLFGMPTTWAYPTGEFRRF